MSNKKREDEIKEDITLNLRNYYEWGRYDHKTLTEKSDKLPEVRKRLLENKDKQKGKDQ